MSRTEKIHVSIGAWRDPGGCSIEDIRNCIAKIIEM